MAEFPSLPLFTDAYLADTRHLTTLQHGAYLLMLMTAWRMPDCKLSGDDEFLARITGMDRRVWMKNKDVILSMWSTDENGKVYQKRLFDERKYVERRREINTHAGRVSALKRKERGSTTVKSTFELKTNQPTPTLTLTPKEEENSIKKLKQKNDLYSEDFERFWRTYPKNDGSKKKAAEVFLKTGVDPEIIIAGAFAYAEHCKRSGMYVAHATTWLNQARWEIDYSTQTDRNQQHDGRNPTKHERLFTSVHDAFHNATADPDPFGIRKGGTAGDSENAGDLLRIAPPIRQAAGSSESDQPSLLQCFSGVSDAKNS